MKSIDDSKQKPYQNDLPEQVFKRVMQYKGQSLKQCNSPHITTRETIALADHIEELMREAFVAGCEMGKGKSMLGFTAFKQAKLK